MLEHLIHLPGKLIQGLLMDLLSNKWKCNKWKYLDLTDSDSLLSVKSLSVVSNYSPI